MTDQPRQKQPSLRDLARHLGVSHSGLSEQIHRGDYSAGVAVVDGRAVVTDLAAAAAAWAGVPTRRAAGLIVLTDPSTGFQYTACQLFDERDAISLLVTALVADALGSDLRKRKRKAHAKRISEQLRIAAPLHGAGDGMVAFALEDLESTYSMLVAAAEPEDEPKDEP